MPTRLGRFCEMVIEAGWLLAAVLVPLFFNLYTATIFEPDKAALLQTIVWVMLLAWATRFAQRPVGWLVDRLGWAIASARAARSKATDEYSPPEVILTPVERRLPQIRIAGPNLLEVLAILFALLVFVSTVTSCQGWASLLGSYQRAQGLFTTLGYVVIMLLAAGHLRGRAQVERLFLAVTLGSLPVAAYAIAQALKIDPIPWGTKGVVAATLGNTPFLAGYLAVVLPLSLAGMLMVIAPLRGVLRADRPRGLGFFAPVLGDLLAALGVYLPALLLQFLALLFTVSSAPYTILGLLLAGPIFVVLLLAAAFLGAAGRIPRLGGVLLVIAGAVVIALILLGAVGLAFTDAIPTPAISLGETGEARPLIWAGARAVVIQWPLANPDGDMWQPLRPVVGYGPETFAYPFNQVYPLALMLLTGSVSVDRACNILLQVTAELGYLGLMLHLALLMGGFLVGLYSLVRGRFIYHRLALVGLLAALTVWMVYAQFYPVPTSVWLSGWLILGALVAVGRQARERPPAEQAYRLRELEEPQRASAVFSGLLLLDVAAVVLFLANLAYSSRLNLESLALLLVGPGVGLAILVAVVNNGLGFWQRRRSSAPGAETPGTGVARIAWAAFMVVGAVIAVLITLALALLALYNLETPQRPTNPQVTPQLVVALTLLAVVGGIVVVAISLKRPAVPLQPIGWGRLVTFALLVPAALVLALILAGVVFLTVYQPTLADITHKSALLNDQAQTWEISTELHQQAIALAPNRDWYYTFLGRAYLEYARTARPDPSQGMEKAAAAFTRGREVNPLNPDHAANLGRMYAAWAGMTGAGTAKETRVDQAGAAYEAAVKLTPHNVKLLRELADMYLKNARLTEAARAFERIVTLTPDDVEAWSYLGSIYAQQNKTSQAVAAYQQVIRLRPDQYGPYLELAKVYQAAGDKAQALEMAKKALERAPDTARPTIQQLINELER